jgi:uncharacterized protein (DUF2336 family)
METPVLNGLAGFADIGLRSGVDMRPTLVRVLTDLYVQKISHTPDEDRHYTELALRLLEAVDTPTRAAVAVRLARHLSPPLRIIQYLINDLPEIAAPLRSHPLLQPPNPSGVTPQQATAMASADVADPGNEGGLAQALVPSAPGAVDGKTAAALNDQFFAGTAYERSLILRNLDVVAPLAAGQVGLSRDPTIGQRLEAAALARNRGDFAQLLASSLHIPREQAQRIARDDLGESILVAAKALNVSRDLVYRILMFVNPTIGHSVERVHALATLYDEMTIAAAEGMVAIWQALQADRHATAKHQTVAWNDDARQRARPAAAVDRKSVV